MKRRFAIVLALLMMFSLLGGCGASKSEPAPDPAPDDQTVEEPTMEPITLKFATSFAGTAASTVRASEAFDRITEQTNGAINFEVYPDNQLGSLADLMEQVKSGMPIMMFVGFDMIGDFVPEAGAIYFPYVFEDIYEIFPLVKSDWFAGVEAKIIESGVTPIGYGAAGYRHFIGSKPVRSADDIVNLKARMAPSAMAQGFIEICGGSPTTSTWVDNYSLIQTGVFDVCEADIQSLWNSSLQEVSQYLSLTGHFTSPCTILINNDIWAQIPAEYQDLIKAELEVAMIAQTDDTVANQDVYLQNFKDSGIEVIENPDKASFAPYIPDLYEHVGLDPALYDAIRTAIEENK